MIMKAKLSIDGRDYYWEGMCLYSKTQAHNWIKIKTYESTIINVSKRKTGLLVETETELLNTDMLGTVLLRNPKHKKMEEAENP